MQCSLQYVNVTSATGVAESACIKKTVRTGEQTIPSAACQIQRGGYHGAAD